MSDPNKHVLHIGLELYYVSCIYNNKLTAQEPYINSYKRKYDKYLITFKSFITQQYVLILHVTDNGIRKAPLLAADGCDRKQDEIERTAHLQDPEVSTGNFPLMHEMSDRKTFHK